MPPWTPLTKSTFKFLEQGGAGGGERLAMQVDIYESGKFTYSVRIITDSEVASSVEQMRGACTMPEPDGEKCDFVLTVNRTQWVENSWESETSVSVRQLGASTGKGLQQF